MQEITDALMLLVQKFSYFGIFIATFVESTFVPIPAEVTLIPAGILAAQGKMNYWLVLLVSTTGVVAGSMLNYWIGLKFGRGFIERYGRYVFLNEKFLEKTERFFQKHGAFAAFAGRLLPGVRHYIAFPAGIARMPVKTFAVYSALGGGIWMWVLLQLGYMAGMKSPDGQVDIDMVETIVLSLSAVLIIFYALKLKFIK